MTDAITYELMGDIAILAANNPPVNALGYDVRIGLVQAGEVGKKARIEFGDAHHSTEAHGDGGLRPDVEAAGTSH